VFDQFKSLIKIICCSVLLTASVHAGAAEWQRNIISDNFKAIDAAALVSTDGRARIMLYRKEPNFAKALGYDEKSVFMLLNIAENKDDPERAQLKYINAQQPLRISFDGGRTQPLTSTDDYDLPLKATQILLSPAGSSASCGLLEQLVYSDRFTLYYAEYYTQKQVAVQFKTPADRSLTGELFGHLKKCLKQSRKYNP